MEMTTMQHRHQSFMLAVRQEMGWPLFKPANDAILFSAGRVMDPTLGIELARIAQVLRKDGVYSGWASETAREPDTFVIAWRGLMMVDVIDRCVPFAADEDAPILFVSTRADEMFAVDGRGSLARLPGKPKGIGKGRKLAMKRIRAAAAQMANAPLEGTIWVPTGGDIVEPDAPLETIVRFV